MLNSQDLEFFIVIAASRSLAAASRKLNVSPPSVSQRLKHLESKLNVKLVERRARNILLTQEGVTLANKAQQLLHDLEDLQQSVTLGKTELTGTLKLVAPVGLGIKHIGPLCADFQQHYPQLNIELQLSDTPNWSAHSSPDILFYIGPLQDSALQRVVLTKNRRLLLASPAYLASSGRLEHPEDLANHRCIALRENDEDATMWRLTDARTAKACNIRISPCLSSNLGQVTKDWCLQGRGIIQRSWWDVVAELERGELVNVLPTFQLETADIVALVSSKRRQRATKVERFLACAKAHFAEHFQPQSDY